MKNIIEFLVSSEEYDGISVIYTHDEDAGNWEKASNVYFHTPDTLYSIAAPHSGNGFRFLLRADDPATHDRWSTAIYEELLPADSDVITALKNWKKEFTRA